MYKNKSKIVHLYEIESFHSRLQLLKSLLSKEKALKGNVLKNIFFTFGGLKMKPG